MAAILSTNMASLYAQRSMASAQAELSGSVEKLSSGKRINSAKDDAAGLGISQSIAGISNINNQSVRNLQNATSLVQTADGALDVVGKMLQRILTLTTQKNDQALNANQRSSIDAEVTALTDEISRIRERTKFNSTGTIFGQTYTFGAGSGVTTTIEIPRLTLPQLGLESEPIRASLVTNNSGTNTFTISGHNLASGDRVTYYQGNGTNISELTNATTYYVINADTNAGTFQLSLTDGGVAVPLTSAGTSTNAYFQKVYSINQVGLDGASTDTLVMTTNINAWSIGRYVLFNSGANTSIVNLSSPAQTLADDRAYQIKSNDGISIQLNSITSPATTITYSPSTDLTDATLGLLSISVETNTTSTPNAFNLSDNSIVNGTQLVLSSASAGGLTQWTTYYARDVGGGTFKIASSLNGPALTISQNGNYTFRRVGTDVANFNVNSVLKPNTIQLDDASGINNGDELFFKETGDAIGGLSNNTSYYVINKAGNTFQLSATSGGTSPVTITSSSALNQASFENVTVADRLSFNPSSVSVLSLSNANLSSDVPNGYQTGDAVRYSVSGGALSGLTNNSTYYVIALNGTDFQLATTRDNAIDGVPMSLGTDGGGDHSFTKIEGITVSTVNTAIANNATNRAKLGSYLSALSFSIDNLETMSNNLGDAYSRIVDTDFAAETANLTKNKILQEASAAMLAQANQMPNVVLSLLR